MKRTITSESLFEFANRKLPISLPKFDIDDEDENFEVGSKDEEWYGEDPEDQEGQVPDKVLINPRTILDI